MRIKILLIVSLVFYSATMASAATTDNPLECDRSCLLGFIDQYLDALIAHDPGRLAVTDGVRFTENTVTLNLGEALWTTATGIGPYRIDMADPKTSQAAYVGVIMENGYPKIMALRLKIVNREISEVETIIARVGLMTPTIPAEMATQTAKSIWSVSLEEDEKVSREQMLYEANQYFEGMEQDNGEIVAFDDSCNRTENGTQTTNNPNLGPMSLGCKAGLNAGGMWIFTTPTRDYWMVDEELGIVIGHFMFTVTGLQKDGTQPPLPTPGDAPSFMGPAEPSSKPIVELFKIIDGRIFEIEAVMGPQAGYGMPTGW